MRHRDGIGDGRLLAPLPDESSARSPRALFACGMDCIWRLGPVSIPTAQSEWEVEK